MRLSEALLLDSVGSKQGFGVLSACPNYKAYGLCAQGSALLAIGVEEVGLRGASATLIDHWPWVKAIVPIPDALVQNNAKHINSPYFDILKALPREPIHSIIWQLNDKCRWTRPEIAAWVAELEVQYDPQVIAQPWERGNKLLPAPTSGR